MPQSLSNFSEAMKETYEPGLRNAINNSNVVWAESLRNEEDLQGNEAVWSIHTGRSAASGMRAELGTLPTPDRQRFNKARKSLAYAYHTIKVSGQAKHLTKNDSAAFAKALETEVKGAEVDLKHSFSRQAFGQAVTVNGALATGVIATLSADPGTGTTLTVANEDASVMRHFFRNMKLDVVNPSDGTIRAGSPVTVASVNKSARTITVTAALNAAIASGDFLVVTGNLDEEIDGLRALIKTSGTYAGIDPASVPEWASLSVGSTTTTVSENIFDEAVEVVETDGDGNSPELIVTEHIQRRKLAATLQAQKRYDGREVELKSGFKGLSLARGTLVVDRMCPTTYGFALHTPELSKFIGLDFQWDDDDGDVFFKALDGSDAVEARLKGYVQLAATNRNSHSLIRLAEPTI